MPYTGTDQGRPIRSTRGIGGQRAQLEKASMIVEEGLLNKVKGQKRDRNNLTDIPENLPENDLAPAIPSKRARTGNSKAVIIIKNLFFSLIYRMIITNCLCNLNQVSKATSRGSVQPLKAAPKPALKFAANGSQYGFPAVSQAGSHAPAHPNRKALHSKTNAPQVNALAISNEAIKFLSYFIQIY
jgi:hypothetical protein